MMVDPLYATIAPPSSSTSPAEPVMRLGPDASEFWLIPREIEVSTEMPGGFGPAQIVVEAPSNFNPFAGLLYGHVRIHDAANRTVHVGRISGLPRTARNELTIEIEGYSKHLEDDQRAQVLFVDADFSRWGEPSKQYQLDQYAYTFEGSSQTPDVTTGAPSIATLTTPHYADDNVEYRSHSAAHYDAGSALDIGSVYYAWQTHPMTGGPLASPAAAWDVYLDSSDRYNSGALVQAGAFDANADGATGSGTLNGTGSQRFALITAYTDGALGPGLAVEVQQGIYWTKVAVYGEHGLTKRGSEGLTSAKGYYNGEMIDHIVDTFAPKINSSLADGNVEAGTFVVPHSAFTDDTTPREMIESLALLGGSTSYPLDWFVYEGEPAGTSGRHANFYLKTPGTYGTEWHVRSDEGASSDNLGEDVAERPVAVKVKYNDGVDDRSVGGTGTGADTETADLVYTDPNHPANRSELDKWHTLDVGINSEAGAKIVGQVYLAEKNRQEWRGSISQIGPLRNLAGAQHPPYMVRAGDQVVDDTDPAGDYRPRYITGTSYNTSSRTLSINVTPNPRRVELLIERLRINMQAAAVGGAGPPKPAGAVWDPASGTWVMPPAAPVPPVIQAGAQTGQPSTNPAYQ